MNNNNIINHFKKTRGYVVANQTNAAFYMDGLDHQFHILTRLSNPEGDWKEGDLDSDKPGRGFSSAGEGTLRHALDRTFKHHEELSKKFSREISEKIEELQKEQAWDELVLVAEPHFLGLLKNAMKPRLKKMIRFEVPKEYRYQTTSELRNHILKVLKK